MVIDTFFILVSIMNRLVYNTNNTLFVLLRNCEMTNNRPMTLEEALDKEHPWYRAIMYAMFTLRNEEIQPKHLKYIFVEQHRLDENTVKKLDKTFSKKIPDFLSIWCIKKLPGRYGINRLNNFLSELKMMKVVEPYPIEGEKDLFYRLTQSGRRLFIRWYVHYMLDTFIPIGATNYEKLMMKLEKKIEEYACEMGPVVVDV